MNQADKMRYRNEIISYVKMYPVKRNIINLNTHNSVEHEMIKSRICFELKKQNVHFVTEAKMIADKNKGLGIADILVLDTAQVIEILVSETEQEARVKVAKYPEILEVVSVTDAESYFNGNYKIIKSKLI